MEEVAVQEVGRLHLAAECNVLMAVVWRLQVALQRSRLKVILLSLQALAELLVVEFHSSVGALSGLRMAETD